ncbi:hypothetical protein N9868_02220 [Akkermansiaceae bacterium]|nr:hypothetical protein [Akkermansiaceae bacterium]MDB4271197.1 hypothetical protein [bacterium]MDA7684273.1 hypothetical protein [Akkermansiaceae bacterium]MDA7862349.1 hypothetical protein [Akkermansiaceae bacterium]MDA8959816.1 hypothetical protein [Akkermansiaceae bacterium]
MIKPSFRDREAGKAFLYFFLGLPWSIILHELGHYFTTVALGHPATLSYVGSF